MKKLRTTPGPAIVFATMPATRYIPVPQHEPTPNDVKSNVVKHFWNNKNETKNEIIEWVQNHLYSFWADYLWWYLRLILVLCYADLHLELSANLLSVLISRIMLIRCRHRALGMKTSFLKGVCFNVDVRQTLFVHWKKKVRMLKMSFEKRQVCWQHHQMNKNKK